MPTRAVPNNLSMVVFCHESSRWWLPWKLMVVVVVFYNFLCNILVLFCFVSISLFCGCGRSVLWWPAKFQRPSGKKKKIPAIWFCVVKTLICGHRLSLLLLFLKWPASSVFYNKFQWAPTILQWGSGELPVTIAILFSVFFFCFRYCRHVLCVSGQCWSSNEVLHFPASLRRCSSEVSNSCFPANLVG